MDTISRDSSSQWPSLILIGLGISMTIMLIVVVATAPNRQEQRMHQRYAVWQKLNARPDISYDEFVVAYRSNLLPNTKN